LNLLQSGEHSKSYKAIIEAAAARIPALGFKALKMLAKPASAGFFVGLSLPTQRPFQVDCPMS
jgi:hypothetical protein